ncbi:hypothetical protein [Streptomyces avermitilis]
MGDGASQQVHKLCSGEAHGCSLKAVALESGAFEDLCSALQQDQGGVVP